MSSPGAQPILAAPFALPIDGICIKPHSIGFLTVRPAVWALPLPAALLCPKTQQPIYARTCSELRCAEILASVVDVIAVTSSQQQTDLTPARIADPRLPGSLPPSKRAQKQPYLQLVILEPVQPRRRPSAGKRGAEGAVRLAGAAHLACGEAACRTEGSVKDTGRDVACFPTLLPVRAFCCSSRLWLGSGPAHMLRHDSRHRLRARLPVETSCWLCGTARGVVGCLPAWRRTT